MNCSEERGNNAAGRQVVGQGKGELFFSKAVLSQDEGVETNRQREVLRFPSTLSSLPIRGEFGFPVRSVAKYPLCGRVGLAKCLRWRDHTRARTRSLKSWWFVL